MRNPDLKIKHSQFMSTMTFFIPERNYLIENFREKNPDVSHTSGRQRH